MEGLTQKIKILKVADPPMSKKIWLNICWTQPNSSKQFIFSFIKPFFWLNRGKFGQMYNKQILWLNRLNFSLIKQIFY